MSSNPAAQKPERPAPEIKPSRDYPGRFDIILWHSSKHSSRIAVTHEELAIIEQQAAAILRP